MRDTFLIILGAIIAGAMSLIGDRVRHRWQREETHSERLRALVEIYIPHMLGLLAGLRAVDYDIARRRGMVTHDNPYPDIDDAVKVPGDWYPQVVRLAHHPRMPGPVRTQAGKLQSGIEHWNAIVDELDMAAHEIESLIADTASLVEALESAVSR